MGRGGGDTLVSSIERVEDLFWIFVGLVKLLGIFWRHTAIITHTLSIWYLSPLVQRSATGAYLLGYALPRT